MKIVQTKYLKISILAMMLALIQGCSSSDDDDVEDSTDSAPVTDTVNDPVGDPISGPVSEPVTDDIDSALINDEIDTATGGVFTTPDSALSIIIPPGALATDAELVVTQANSSSSPTGNVSSAGDSFNIAIGSDIINPIELRFVIDNAPTHPELAESAFFDGNAFTRSPSNFFKASENTIISLVSQDGTYQPVFRTLQTENSDLVERGRDTFLNETFGNEAFFTDVIGLQDLLNNLSPQDAIGVGVQVDVTRVPQEIVDVLSGDDFAAKSAALQDPAVTRALLRAGAVVGVTTTFSEDSSDTIESAGVTCALCHAIVEPTEFELTENTFTALPIGPLLLNGMPNTAMDVGAILSLTPFAQNAGPDVVSFLQGFGVGRFDARALPDNPLEDNVSNPTSIPPIWNFVDLDEQGYTWNWDGLFTTASSRDEAVYDLVLHANGAFGTASSSVPAALSVPPPQATLDSFIAAEDNAPGNDVQTQAVLDVQAWERSIVSPPPGDFDEALAEEGFRVFNNQGQCIECHSTAEFTGPVLSTDIVLVPPQGGLANGIKTPGLRGVKHIAPYFHDDSADTLLDVMNTYSGRIVNVLTEQEKLALVEYLNSL